MVFFHRGVRGIFPLLYPLARHALVHSPLLVAKAPATSHGTIHRSLKSHFEFRNK